MECIIYPSHILDVKSERRIIIGLLYIINHKRYLEHYKKGFIKHIPEFFLPKIKSKIIDDIIQEDNIIGRIAGVNIKPIEFNNEKELEEYIIGIRDVRTENCTSLYIEEYKDITDKAINYIENSLNMKIYKGDSTRIIQIPIVIKEIYKLLGENLQEKEVLVLCKDKEISKKIIKEISKDIRFITCIGCNKEDEEEIYEHILEETGLSLFYSSNIGKILENYSIIINLMDDFNLNTSRIKRNCIIFDYSNRYSLKNKESKLNISNRIEDFVFNLKSIGIKETKWIDNKAHSDLYESLNQSDNQKISYLYSGNDYYTVENYVNTFIKVRGKL